MVTLSRGVDPVFSSSQISRYGMDCWLFKWTESKARRPQRVYFLPLRSGCTAVTLDLEPPNTDENLPLSIAEFEREPDAEDSSGFGAVTSRYCMSGAKLWANTGCSKMSMNIRMSGQIIKSIVVK